MPPRRHWSAAPRETIRLHNGCLFFVVAVVVVAVAEVPCLRHCGCLESMLLFGLAVVVAVAAAAVAEVAAEKEIAHDLSHGYSRPSQSD